MENILEINGEKLWFDPIVYRKEVNFLKMRESWLWTFGPRHIPEAFRERAEDFIWLGLQEKGKQGDFCFDHPTGQIQININGEWVDWMEPVEHKI